MFDVAKVTDRAVVQFDLEIMTVYELTLYEIAVIGRRYEEKRQCEMENIICQAWHTEAFARQKKLPKLSKLIKDIRKKPKKQTSASDQILKAMAKAKGVTIK